MPNHLSTPFLCKLLCFERRDLKALQWHCRLAFHHTTTYQLKRLIRSTKKCLLQPLRDRQKYNHNITNDKSHIKEKSKLQLTSFEFSVVMFLFCSFFCSSLFSYSGLGCSWRRQKTNKKQTWLWLRENPQHFWSFIHKQSHPDDSTHSPFGLGCQIWPSFPHQ